MAPSLSSLVLPYTALGDAPNHLDPRRRLHLAGRRAGQWIAVFWPSSRRRRRKLQLPGQKPTRTGSGRLFAGRRRLPADPAPPLRRIQLLVRHTPVVHVRQPKQPDDEKDLARPIFHPQIPAQSAGRIPATRVAREDPSGRMEFRPSRRPGLRQSVARFQFDGDEIGNESLFRFRSYYRPVVEQSSVRFLCEEFDAVMGAFAHFQSRIPSPSATTEGTRRLLATGSVEPTRALAPTDETRKLQLAQTPNMMYKTQRM